MYTINNTKRINNNGYVSIVELDTGIELVGLYQKYEEVDLMSNRGLDLLMNAVFESERLYSSDEEEVDCFY